MEIQYKMTDINCEGWLFTLHTNNMITCKAMHEQSDTLASSIATTCVLAISQHDESLQHHHWYAHAEWRVWGNSSEPVELQAT